MNMTEFINQITMNVNKAVAEALTKGINLEAGERCPCCGAKKRKPNVSEKMIEANRRNILKAIAARKLEK